MTSSRQHLGRLGENLAHGYLKQSGWLVLDRNWRCRWGEIDLVCLDGSTVVICEVRTRQGVRAGSGIESVTLTKMRRLRLLAGQWILARGARPRAVRIDVIGVQLHPDGHHSITHLRGVE